MQKLNEKEEEELPTLKLVQGGKTTGGDWLTPLVGKTILVGTSNSWVLREFEVKKSTGRSIQLLEDDGEWFWIEPIFFCTTFYLQEVLENDVPGD